MTVNIFDMAQTWNNGATTFSGMKLNVTDTASASASLLMDLQVGGTSKFNVKKNGALLTQQVADFFDFRFSVTQFGVGVESAGYYGISSSGSSAGTHDVRIYRDAANTLGQRNGTAAQTFNIYNTYTDASNYERGFMKWNANVLEIGTEQAGTGSVRNIKLFTGSLGQILLSHSGAGNRGLRIHSTDSFSVLQFTNGTTGETAGVGTMHYQSGLNYVIENQSSGGAISIQPNTGGLKITSLPTTNPSVAGQIWNDSGTLKISAG